MYCIGPYPAFINIVNGVADAAKTKVVVVKLFKGHVQ